MNKEKYKKWLIAYLRQPFRMIVWVMETFAKNRARLNTFLEKDKVSSAFKTIITVTLFVWLGVFAFLATSEDGDRFSCAVRSLYSGFDSSDCPAQPWEPAPKSN